MSSRMAWVQQRTISNSYYHVVTPLGTGAPHHVLGPPNLYTWIVLNKSYTKIIYNKNVLNVFVHKNYVEKESYADELCV
jgi:hypothetical protein